MARREQGVKSRTTKDGRTLWDAYWSVAGVKHMRRGLATAKDAGRVRREALAAADRGEHVASSRETLGAYLERWAASKDGTTRGRLTRHVIPSLGKIALQKLTAEDVEAHYTFLMEGEGLGANSVRLVHGALKAAMNDAERRRRVVVNVMRHVDPPREEEPGVPDPWSVDEVKRLMAVAQDDRLAVLWRLYVDTGA